MKKRFTYICSLCLGLLAFQTSAFSQTTLRIFDQVLFYDGYADTSILPKPGPPGVLRLSTSLYSTRLEPDTLSKIGSQLSMKILVKAACDNYDRIGNVFLAFVHKGDTTYDPSKTTRMEIARFITPFMNKNKSPDTVSYSFNIDNVASLLKDKQITDTADIWLELSIFGVPYAANTQVAGCSGRNDVFYGTVDLITNNPDTVNSVNILNILSNYKSFNNYNPAATDAVGQTVRTISFTLDSVSYNTKVHLITSNHGANPGGEEYNRRMHYVYFDSAEVLVYKPGFPSCEPYRKYNTQANGIYGSSKKSDAAWQSFSNWCPGAIIPIRTIDVGTLQPGTHEFKIYVPTAEFVNKEGDIPLTAYVQGKRVPQATTGISEAENLNAATRIFPNPSSDFFTIESDRIVKEVKLYTLLGQEVYTSSSSSVSINSLEAGVYSVKILFEGGLQVVKLFIKN
jgi:hypothetical protein